MPPQAGPKQTIPTRLMSESDNQIAKFVLLWGVRLGTPVEPKKKKTCRVSKHTPRGTKASPNTRAQQHEHVSLGLTEATTMVPRPYLPPESTADHHGVSNEAQSHYTPHARQSTTDSVKWTQPHSTATQAPSHWHSGQVVGPNVAENTHGPSHDFYPSMYDASQPQELPQDQWQYQYSTHYGYAVAHPQRIPEDAYASSAVQYGSLGVFRADSASSSLATRGPGESAASLFAADSDSEMAWSETFPVPPQDYRAYAMQPQGMYYTPSSGGPSMGGGPVIQQNAAGGWYPEDDASL